MKLFNGKDRRLCVDQYNSTVWATTLDELREKSGHGSSPKNMYRDKKGGRTVHCGYVVGPRWFSVYAAVEIDS